MSLAKQWVFVEIVVQYLCHFVLRVFVGDVTRILGYYFEDIWNELDKK